MSGGEAVASMSGGEAVASTLAAIGVRHVFGIVSVHNLPIYEALSRHADIDVVKVRHEQGAAHAADAYARATGELVVVLTSTGPGAANAIAGLYEAAFTSSRVLMITGQVESRFYGKGKGFIHENERQIDLLRSVCRAVASVRQTEEIPAEIMRVAHDICTGRPQPGAVEVPIDLQYRKAKVDIPAWVPPRLVAPDSELLDSAAERLVGAVRPLIWAGGGVNISGASGELTELAELIGAPVVTSIEGRGAMAEDHELCLGFCTDRRIMRSVFEEADLLLAVGTRFQNYATAVWSLRLPSDLIHLDVDPGVIGLNYPASLAIVADAKLGLAGLVERVGTLGGVGADAVGTGGVGVGGVDTSFADRARKYRADDDELLRTEIGADHSAICDTIRRILPPEGCIVRDSTVPAYMWGNRLLPILRSRTSIRPGAVAIGPGVPMGIGACVGTGAPTVVIQGDGGLLLSVGELSACAEHNLGVIVLVFNDIGYGVLRVIQDAVFDAQHGTDLPRTDFVKVAEAMGVTSEAVSGVAEFEVAFERAVERATSGRGPSLLDIDMAQLEPINFALPAHQSRR